ncbi:MAG: hypothetical protein WCN92_03740 [Eubacteriales bacterium]
MKSNIKRILALFLVLTFIFAFSACKGNKTETTAADATTIAEDTTAAAETTVAEETTLPIETTTLSGGTTAAATTLTAETTTTTAGTTVVGITTAVATTVKPVSITAPVGGTIAQIVAFYNQYANATKAFKGKVTIDRTDGTTGKIQALSPDISLIRNEATSMLKGINTYPQHANKTFVNGMSGTDSLQKFLPRSDYKTLSELQAAGVKSASCVKNGTGWKVSIVLKPEQTTNLNDHPKYNYQCMDTVNISNDDLKPFTLGGAQVSYKGSTIAAQINSKGFLDTLTLYEPDSISGTLKYSFINLITTTIVGTWQSKTIYTY